MSRLFSCLILVVALVLAGNLSPLPAQADSTKPVFSSSQSKAIEKIVHDYLLAHPEVIVEAMHELDAREKAQSADKFDKALAKNRQQIYNDPNSFVAGNRVGDITIVEFFDYQCGYCKHTFGPLMQALKNDSRIRLVLKEFPILGPTSITAARAVMAAGRQGKYFELHKALYENKGSLSDEKVIEIARDIGLDIKKLAADMKSPELGKIIDRNYALADALGIDGTPAFIIGDKLYPGALDAERLEGILKDMRKK